MLDDKPISESVNPSVKSQVTKEMEVSKESKVVARKVLAKKRPIVSRKKRLAGRSPPGSSNSSLKDIDVKKVKKNGSTTPTSSDYDFNVCTSVPSVASTDSDLPESLMSPTDEETCSYITEEEFSGTGDCVSVCSDFDVNPDSATNTTKGDTSLSSIPALRFSALPNLPPYLNFCLHDEHVLELPWPMRRYLKWKLSTITPLCVRKTVISSGFRVIKEPKEWVGTWGKHMKSLLFRLIQPHQKVNHFPGTFQIGRKDRLWRNLQKMAAKYGNEEFNFLPKTFILPHDLRLLRQVWHRGTTDMPWIVKPPASARGTGIQVIHQWNQLPRKRPLVVQSYVKNPFLINNTKFDIRLYVLVTSINPLRIYLYEDGLVRFASLNYSNDVKSLSDSYVHLTNYSINKNCEEYVANEDANRCQGHKWTLKCLWNYMEEQGIDVDSIKGALKDIVIKTLLSVETTLLDMGKGNVSNRYQCYELFGFDILLDEQLKPWLLEVNISPSLHSSSSLDLSVKGPLIRDVFNMACFHVPNHMNSASKKHLSEYINTYFYDQAYEKKEGSDEGSQYCLDIDFYTMELTEEEQKKHLDYESRYATVPSNGGAWLVESKALEQDDPTDKNLLDKLTQDDLRHLIQTEDELSQAKGFSRIFPAHLTGKYFRFMDKIRYYNLLLNEWQMKFGSDRESAVDFIKKHWNPLKTHDV